MAEEKKVWWKSKTIISCIVTVIIAAYNAAIPGLCEGGVVCLPDIPDWVFMLLASFGIYGRATVSKGVSIT